MECFFGGFLMSFPSFSLSAGSFLLDVVFYFFDFGFSSLGGSTSISRSFREPSSFSVGIGSSSIGEKVI